MNSTFMAEHPWLSPAALVVLVVLGPLVEWRLTGIALLLMAFVTLAPGERQIPVRCKVA